MNHEEHVLLSIPIPIAGKVHELAAQFYAKRSPEVTSREEAKDELLSDWPPELIQRAWRESPPSMKKLLKYLSARADERIFSAEIIETLGLDSRDGTSGRRVLAGTLGAFGRRVRNRYRRDTWPFYAEWEHTRNEMGYRMTTDVAKQIGILAERNSS